jgi:hypothetical protein
MPTYFKLISKKINNGKWVSKFNLISRDGEKNTHQNNWIDGVEFNSKEEADSNATKYCLKKGYIQEN